MDLIPRYLQAVKFWLPARQQDDIIAELAEDLRAEGAEREAALERPLEAAEVEAILRRRGAPILVASRYRPQQALIGPVLFPIYWIVLKLVVAAVVALTVLGWLVAVASTIMAHAGAAIPWGAEALTRAEGLAPALLLDAAIVTLVFAVIERSGAAERLLGRWNPRNLRPVRAPDRGRDRKRRINSAAQAVGCLVLVVAWAIGIVSPTAGRIGNLRVEFAPSWVAFFWIILLLTVATGAWAAVSFARPRPGLRRLATRLVIDLATGVTLAWLLKASIFARVTVPGVTPDRALLLAGHINQLLIGMFPVWVVIVAVKLGFNLRLVYRHTRGAAPAAAPAALS